MRIMKWISSHLDLFTKRYLKPKPVPQVVNNTRHGGNIMVILDDNENTNQVVEREPEQIYRIGGPVKRPKEVNMSTTELLNLFNDNKPKANTVVVEHAVTAPKVDELNITPSPK